MPKRKKDLDDMAVPKKEIDEQKTKHERKRAAKMAHHDGEVT
jgi:hypothetical protein